MSSNEPQTQVNLQPPPPRTGSKKTGQLVVGVLLMISSSLTIIFGIVAVSLPTIYYAYGGNPLWTGVIILISGILCTCASRSINKCFAIGGLVMNIISIFFAIDQILWMSVSAAREDSYNEYCVSYKSYKSYYGSYYHTSYYEVADCDAEIAIDVVLIVLGLFELAFAISAVCVLSVSICCPTQQQTTRVMYHTGQPMVIQGGYVAPGYPPQTHIMTQSDQMYIHQQGPPSYPAVQVQYAGGQPQQFHAGQPQQYPTAQPQQYPTGQPQQYPTVQPQQYPTVQSQQYPDEKSTKEV